MSVVACLSDVEYGFISDQWTYQTLIEGYCKQHDDGVVNDDADHDEMAM